MHRCHWSICRDGAAAAELIAAVAVDAAVAVAVAAAAADNDLWAGDWVAASSNRRDRE